MFWASVLGGLKVLTYWETYVAVLEYLAIIFIPAVSVGMIMKKREATKALVGWVSMLLIPVLQVIALVVLVLTLTPILFGFADAAIWVFPWKLLTLSPGEFFKVVGVLVAAALVMAFIPILRKLKPLQTLVLGGIALVLVLDFISADPEIVKGDIDFFPGFWFSTGIVVLGGIVSWVGRIAASLIVIAMRIEMAEEGLGQFIMFPIAAIFGFIPVFMYGAWLGAQARGGF
jgi:hypothetical protein